MDSLLDKGALQRIKDDGYTDPVTVQVVSLDKINDTKYKCTVKDGVDTASGILASQLTDLVASGALSKGCITKLLSYVANKVGNELKLMITDLEVLSCPDTQMDNLAPPTATSVEGQGASTPIMNKIPAFKRVLQDSNGCNTPGPTPSPSEEHRVKFSKAPMAPSTPPLSLTPPSNRKTFHKIAALHPLEDQWCIKAKLSRKYPIRTINTQRGETKLFTVELIDDMGKQVQGTFWRQQAERYHDLLQEGRVYVFSKFQVKPSNKAYSSVKNDYEIHFNDRSEVLESVDQDTTAMTAAVEVVPIDQLIRHVGRKAPVDVLGVVTSLSALGTVKRKSDSTEVHRRDITLVDRSSRSVVLTLWGDNAIDKAAELEECDGAVVLVTACRVTDFNGCSLSTLTKSTVTINPSSKAASKLQQWYLSEGKGQAFTPVGQEAAGNRTPGAAGARQDQVHFISALTPQTIPEPEAKPTFHNVVATIVQINPDQALYYLANPENGRKVVEQDGRYYSEFEHKYVDHACHRYILNARVQDETGQCYISLFNEEAEMVLGIKADDLAELKASDPDRFNSTMKAAQWSQWGMTISSRSREFNGERRMRHTVSNLHAMNFAAEGARLMELINRFQ